VTLVLWDHGDPEDPQDWMVLLVKQDDLETMVFVENLVPLETRETKASKDYQVYQE